MIKKLFASLCDVIRNYLRLFAYNTRQCVSNAAAQTTQDGTTSVEWKESSSMSGKMEGKVVKFYCV